jgi:hypothetical protein
MEVSIKAYIVPKESELFYDCADRYAYDKSQNKFAISDGVTKSFFPKIWADILVNKWVSSKEFDETQFITDCQKDWLNQVTEIVKKPDAKFFTKNAFNSKKPGLATFIGLRFYRKKKEWFWKAHALGDSFLFFVPKKIKNFSKECIVLSSKKEPIHFDNFPDYLSSLGDNHKGDKQYKENPITSGTFYLMTDALAEWFLNEKDNAISKIAIWQNQKDFERFVDEERQNKKLGNDDSAILIIRIEAKRKETANYIFEDVSDIHELIKIQQNEIEVAKRTKEQESFLQAENPNSETESEQNSKEIIIKNELNEIKNSEQNVEGRTIKNEITEESEPLKLKKKSLVSSLGSFLGISKNNPIIESGKTKLEEVSAIETKEEIDVEKNEKLSSNESNEVENSVNEEVIENEFKNEDSPETFVIKPNEPVQKITDKF